MATEENWPFYPLTPDDMRWLANFINQTSKDNRNREEYIEDILERYPKLKASMPQGLMEKLRVLGGIFGVGDLYRDMGGEE